MHARRTTNHQVVRTYLSTERRFSDGFLGFFSEKLMDRVAKSGLSQKMTAVRLGCSDAPPDGGIAQGAVGLSMCPGKPIVISGLRP